MIKKLMVWSLALAALLWTAVAVAGTIAVHDSTGFVSASDTAALQAHAGDWPFDVHVLAENAPSRDALDDDAHNALTDPGVFVIAIDPTHHKTVVRFGKDTGVKAGDYDSIASAGNAHFRAHEVEAGIEAIIARARASREAKVAISASSEPVVIEHGMTTGGWVLIVVLIGGFVWLSVWLYRRSRQERSSFESALVENRLETAELRSRNVEEMTLPRATRSVTFPKDDPQPRPRDTYAVERAGSRAYPPPYAPATAVVAPMVVQSNSGNDMLTGMLIGEALSGRNREVVVEREVEREAPRHHHKRSSDSGGSSSSWDSSGSSSWGSSSSSSSDSGGSSSSWDSSGSSSWGSSSSSSSDSGGSSSSWDSGGSSSFDSGGGGFDGGGGGSSW